MTVSTVFPGSRSVLCDRTEAHHSALLRGEILVTAQSNTQGQSVAIAQMYLPYPRNFCWREVTDYPRWVEYFPDLSRSELLSSPSATTGKAKRLYQVGVKNFILFNVQVEIYLQVFEIPQQTIQFRLEKGDFSHFTADLDLQDYHQGTLITYSLQATPNIPIPQMFIQQALQLEMPTNLKQMRYVLQRRAAVI